MNERVKELSRELLKKAQRKPFEYSSYEGVYSGCELLIREGMVEDGVELLRWTSEKIAEIMPTMVKVSKKEAQQLYELHKKVLLLAAPYDLDSYMQYIEWEREPKKKFYVPRRKQLKVVVDALQELADDKLDLLAISLAPGTGKSTTAIFFLTWLAGRNPDAPILTGSHSNSWVRGAYDECLRIMDKDGEYLWRDVFPDVVVSSTNAKDCRIDLGRRKRFESLQFTSIGTGNAGLYRAMQLLYCDDLVSGLEVALSRERLDKLWGIYNTDLRQRKIGNCKELHVCTRWATTDPVGRLEEEYGGTSRAKFINFPVMDENDESNFDYPYGVGFSTKMLREQRAIMDDASWKALFMGVPVDRDGVLFAEDELRRYYELPEGQPDAVVAVCDSKDRGMDYFVLPIAYQYGPDFYIEAVVCDNSNPDVVIPQLVSMLYKHGVHLARFESNQAGGRIATTVQENIKEMGGRTKITTKYTTSNKEARIIANSPWIKEHCLFKHDSVTKDDKAYRRFMRFLCSYTMGGKNKFDDVPDGMSQLSEFVQSFALNKVEIVKRPF